MTDTAVAAPVEQSFDEHLAAHAAPPAGDAHADDAADAAGDDDADAAQSADADRTGRADAGSDGDADADARAASDAARVLNGRKQTARERIAQLEWQAGEAERKAARLQAELDARTPKTDTTDTTAAPDPDKPRLKTYVEQIGTTYADWEEANEAFIDARDAYRDRQQQTASAAEKAQKDRQAALHQARLRGRDAHPDFDAVIDQFARNGGAFAPRNAQEARGVLADLEDALLTHPKGASAAYLLAKDPALYARVTNVQSRVEFYTEFAKLVSQLEGAPPGASPAKPVKSTAVPPLTPVTSSPVAATDRSTDDESLDAHIARENRLQRGRRR